MTDADDLVNRLIENHKHDFDLKTPAKHANKVKANTPKYIIVSKGIFSDVIKGHKDAGPCYAFKSSIYRIKEDNDNEHSRLISSGKIVQKDVIVCVPTGLWGASIQAHMDQCITAKEITIIRSELEDTSENVIQETTFTNCKIMTYDQIDDKIVFSFNYESKTDDFTDYTKDGLKKGHAAITIKSEKDPKKGAIGKEIL